MGCFVHPEIAETDSSGDGLFVASARVYLLPLSH
jgi:hypothetical protein